MNFKLIVILILTNLLMPCIYPMNPSATKPTLKWADNQKDEFLFRAVISRDLCSVKKALTQGANINARCAGKTALAMACDVGTPIIAQHLISSGADCDICDDRGLPPLYHALQGIYTPQCTVTVEVLVANGANIGIQKRQFSDTIVPEGSTPIHRIAEIMQNTRFGDRSSKDFDISTAPEVFKRLELILTIMVKEIIRQAHREKNPRIWETRLKKLFAKENDAGKAAYQLFENYQQFTNLLIWDISESPKLELHDLLEYKLFRLLHPELGWQYEHKPYLLAQNVRDEQALLDD